MTNQALEGIRVIEFGHVWAAPYCTAVLSDMGAQVIKVESRQHLDIHRKQGPFPGKQRGVNRSTVWNAQNRGKLGCTLNLSQPKGIELAKALVSKSDVVVENYRSGVMQRLGLGHDALKEIKPDIITVSLTGYGQTGPMRNYASYGTVIEAYSGLASVTGYQGGPPACMGESYPDPLAALYGVFAILVALHHRAETGRGQYIDVSQLEAIMCHLPEPMLDYTMNGRIAERMGNRDLVTAPHGCYRCKNKDEWVAIAVATDAEWEAFCRILGDPDWCHEERFSDRFSRWNNQDALDERIECWTKQCTANEVMQKLQSVGVAAGPSFNIEQLLNDPHIKSRNAFVKVHHPEIGDQVMYAPTWHLSKTPGGIQRHAPLLGGDNDYVFGDLLGLTDSEIDQFSKDQIIY